LLFGNISKGGELTEICRDWPTEIGKWSLIEITGCSITASAIKRFGHLFQGLLTEIVIHLKTNF